MSAFTATVASSTRRHTEICTADFKLIWGKVAARDLKVTVGDSVKCEERKGEIVIIERLARRNVIERAYQGKAKELAANVDHLLIVAAVGDLFNTVFVDRVIAVAMAQNIPFTIVVNKIDLLAKEPAETIPLINLYRSIGFSVIETSVNLSTGIDSIRYILNQKDLFIVALTGVSGVGKSSLINSLLPNAQIRVQEVSDRTGQGRQTTTQAIALPYPENDPQKLLIDMPGLQKYGISHLSEDEVKYGFPDFLKFADRCKFSNCSHLSEVDCGVVDALNGGLLAHSRYESYRGMIREIEESKPY